MGNDFVTLFLLLTSPPASVFLHKKIQDILKALGPFGTCEKERKIKENG